jgi:hypothetical protein
VADAGAASFRRKASLQDKLEQARQRVASEEAKQAYQLRAATAECVNAQACSRGLQRLPVRGRPKVSGVVLMFALAHHLLRAVALASRWFGVGSTPSAATAGAA